MRFKPTKTSFIPSATGSQKNNRWAFVSKWFLFMYKSIPGQRTLRLQRWMEIYWRILQKLGPWSGVLEAFQHITQPNHYPGLTSPHILSSAPVQSPLQPHILQDPQPKEGVMKEGFSSSTVGHKVLSKSWDSHRSWNTEP